MTGHGVAGDVGRIGKFAAVSTEVVYKDAGSVIAYRPALPDKRIVTVCFARIDYRHYGLNRHAARRRRLHRRVPPRFRRRSRLPRHHPGTLPWPSDHKGVKVGFTPE